MGGFLFGIFIVAAIAIIVPAIFWLLEWVIMGIAYIISCLFKGWD